MKSQKLKAIKAVLSKLNYYNLKIQDLTDFVKKQEPEKTTKKSNKKK